VIKVYLLLKAATSHILGTLVASNPHHTQKLKKLKIKKMKRNLKLIIPLFLFTSLIAQSQNKWKVAKQATGDLNKDNIADYVIVSELKKSSEETIYSLQIFITKTDGTFTKVLSTNKAIEPSYVGSGSGFGDVTIVKGVITITTNLLRGNYSTKFRLQNGKFVLIGYDSNGCDNSGCETQSYNAVTGLRTIKIQDKSTDEIISFTKKIVKMNPLPNLKDYTFDDFTTRLFPEY
jgi:hypothetical protein